VPHNRTFLGDVEPAWASDDDEENQEIEYLISVEKDVTEESTCRTLDIAEPRPFLWSDISVPSSQLLLPFTAQERLSSSNHNSEPRAFIRISDILALRTDSSLFPESVRLTRFVPGQKFRGKAFDARRLDLPATL